MKFNKAGSIINLSDDMLNNKFAWKRKCFKNPFLGFENELELREYRKIIDRYSQEEEDNIEVNLTQKDYKEFDFSFFMLLKNKMYGASVHRILKRSVKEYETPFLTKKDNQTLEDNNLFIRMFITIIKKKKRLSDLDDFFNKDKENKELIPNLYFEENILYPSWRELLEEEIEEDDYSFRIEKNNSNKDKLTLREKMAEIRKKKAALDEEEEDRSIWTLNQRIMADIKLTLERPLKEIISTLFDQPKQDFDIKTMIFWSEETIPYFFLNLTTGVTNYEFWNNTDERVERRNEVIELWKKGKKTWADVKAEDIKIPTNMLRGLFGLHDLVLLKQKSFLNNTTPFSKNQKYLPYITKIYNLFQNPEQAALYPKVLFGLVGPTLVPQWCLLFTITKKRKNIYFTVADMAGKVLLTVSAGMFNIHRRKRFSPHALEPLFQKVLGCFKKFKIKNVILILKFKAKYMHLHTFNFFRKNRIFVRMVIDKLPVPHNGIRARKQKRL